MKQSRKIEAAYIGHTRDVIKAQAEKRQAIAAELAAKRAAAQSMNTVQIREFDITENGTEYNVQLARPVADRISPQRLYMLVRDGEITLEDFLECVFVVEPLAKELVTNDSQFESLREHYRKPLDLIITEK